MTSLHGFLASKALAMLVPWTAVWFARSYFIGIWCVLFYLLMAIFAIISLRKRHILWFILGFFLPFFWLVGAILPDRRLRREERRDLRLDEGR